MAAANRKTIATKTVTAEGITMTFSDGEAHTLSFADLSDEIKQKLFQHGIGAKSHDSYAGCGGNLAESKANLLKLWDALLRGEYTARIAGDKHDDFAIALAELLVEGGKAASPEEAATMIEGFTPEALKTYRKHPKVQLRMAQNRTKRLEAAIGGEDSFL